MGKKGREGTNGAGLKERRGITKDKGVAPAVGLKLLDMRVPKEVFGLRAPRKVKLMERGVVGKEDDLGLYLRFKGGIKTRVKVAEESTPVINPARIKDDRAKVKVNLKAFL